MDNETSVKPLWGPWSPNLKSAIERTAQLRCLAGLVRVITKGNVSLVRALRVAEICQRERDIGNLGNDDPARDIERQSVTLEHARRLFDALPTLEQRQIIATFASINAPLDSKQMNAPDPPPTIPMSVSEMMAQYTGGLPPLPPLPPVKVEGESYSDDPGGMLDPFPYE